MKIENLIRASATDVAQSLTFARPGVKCVTPGQRGALSTGEVLERLHGSFPQLEFPFLGQDHLHGVQSGLHTLCKEHGIVSRVSMPAALYGGLKYGCDICAALNGAANRKASGRFNDQNMSRRKLQSGIFLAVKAICPDTQWEVTLPDGKELDIYIPSLKLGIEHNGLYWHSSKMQADTAYHAKKNISAGICDIAVIHVWEDMAIPPFTTITNLVKLAKGDLRITSKKAGEIRLIPHDQALHFHRNWNLRPTELADNCESHIGFVMRGAIKAVFSLRGNCVMAASSSAVGVPVKPILEYIKRSLNVPTLFMLADCLTPVEASLVRGIMRRVGEKPPIQWDLDNSNRLCTITGNVASGNVVWDCGYVKLAL